jgi:hypothetical protein
MPFYGFLFEIDEPPGVLLDVQEDSDRDHPDADTGPHASADAAWAALEAKLPLSLADPPYQIVAHNSGRTQPDVYLTLPAAVRRADTLANAFTNLTIFGVYNRHNCLLATVFPARC